MKHFSSLSKLKSSRGFTLIKLLMSMGFLSIIAIAASTVTVKMLSAESIRKNYYTARESVDIVLLFLAIQLTEAFTLMTLIC